jgi:type II secretory pathway pseudopilin PulG
MAVVLITGVLAALAVVVVRNHVNAAKSSRALVGVQAIRVAEEQYRAQGGQYLGCSALVSPKWYPAESPDTTTHDWRQTAHDDWECWKLLGIPRTSGTQYSYLVNAGRPGEAYPPLQTETDPTLPTPAPDLWYVIQVKGDIDGDGVPMLGVAASFGGHVYVENETE